ncbi:hypothetical protein JKP88DRAFT_225526 [Tribonema minus]|uniref:Uncharacterized protein n=1 Tax=Tribonema minus TaxID=303371 RepID=A0A835YQS1_9STRA|nr:hypothetical protein JKP88DRAFT_225526 [Tribonema minus]
MSGKAATTFWRIAGLSYLEYAAATTTALRMGLKEPMRSKAMTRNAVSYNRAVFKDGVSGAKKPVKSLADAGNL